LELLPVYVPFFIFRNILLLDQRVDDQVVILGADVGSFAVNVENGHLRESWPVIRPVTFLRHGDFSSFFTPPLVRQDGLLFNELNISSG